MQDFLVIGGPPRSGTRFIANALNAHPDVVVQGEMHPEMLRNSLEYFRKNNRLYKEIDKKQKGEQVGSKYWKRNRQSLFYKMVCAGQKINVLQTPKGTGLAGFQAAPRGASGQRDRPGRRALQLPLLPAPLRASLPVLREPLELADRLRGRAVP